MYEQRFRRSQLGFGAIAFGRLYQMRRARIDYVDRVSRDAMPLGPLLRGQEGTSGSDLVSADVLNHLTAHYRRRDASENRHRRRYPLAYFRDSLNQFAGHITDGRIVQFDRQSFAAPGVWTIADSLADNTVQGAALLGTVGAENARATTLEHEHAQSTVQGGPLGGLDGGGGETLRHLYDGAFAYAFLRTLDTDDVLALAELDLSLGQML